MSRTRRCALEHHGAEFLDRPEIAQKGGIREPMPMTVADGCGSAVECAGLRRITDVDAVHTGE